jgi:cell division protein FtsI/penicillin-binding protein 2
LSATSHPAALVAVRASDGALLAVASTPDDSSFDRAVLGSYPPGSTFKVVTTYALLGAGITPVSTVPCPPRVVVDGKVFSNFEHETNGNASFAEDFARSCNTAFIGAASAHLRTDSLGAAAAAFGLAQKWSLPVTYFGASVPPPADPVEAAADAIGQGRVEVSPLALAMVAAAVDSGVPRPPILVTDPPPTPGSTLPALDPARLAALRTLMAAVVRSGTAAGAGLPAGTVGKTGTAEFGAGNPPQTHAWFLGYRGDLAFAVLVEGGGVGGQVAAPIAARFLRSLNGYV